MYGCYRLILERRAAANAGVMQKVNEDEGYKNECKIFLDDTNWHYYLDTFVTNEKLIFLTASIVIAV